MKKVFGAFLLFAAASLVGCASQRFEMIGEPITYGDATYAALVTEVINPWGTNVVSTHLARAAHHPTGDRYHQPQCYTPPPKQQTSMRRRPCSCCSPAVARRPTPRVIVMTRSGVVLSDSQIVNSNNQGSIGWANGAFQGAVGDAILGGSMMGAACLLKPTKISAGGASASASSSAAAASN